MKKKTTKNLLERFSCFLVGGGKKISGHKILMESLFSLRENYNLNQFSENVLEKDKSFGSLSITDHKEQFQHKEKAIQQFLCLPCVSISINSKTYKKETPPIFQFNEQLKKTLQKKVVGREGKKEQTEIDSRENINELFNIKKLLNKNLCLDSVDNVKPILETRKIRKGRVTYKVPKVTSSIRQEGKAISLLIESANLRKKNELRRSGSFTGDVNTMSQSSTNIENPQNKVDFSLPLLFCSQSAIGQSVTKASPSSIFDSIFLILPSVNQNFDKKNNNTTKEKKHDFLQSAILERKGVDKNIFFVNLEKKHFLTNLQKANIKYCLSEELFDSVNTKGNSIEKKKQLHNIALQNRAYQHFRWW